MTICHLKYASQFSVTIQLNDRKVDAVVDTTAEISIVSDKMTKSLKKAQPKLRDIDEYECFRGGSNKTEDYVAVVQ